MSCSNNTMLVSVLSILVIFTIYILATYKYRNNPNIEEYSNLRDFKKPKSDNVLMENVSKSTTDMVISDNLSIPFYYLYKDNSMIYLSNVNAATLTFSFFFTSLKDTLNKQVLASSKYWYIEVVGRMVRFVFNNIILENPVNIDKDILYHCSIVIDNRNLKLIVNQNEVSKNVDMLDYETSYIKLGLDKNNLNSFYGKIGGININKDNLTNEEICEISGYCETKNIETEQCNYKPYGQTFGKCIQNCIDSKENCNVIDCQEKCISCKDDTHCAWLPKKRIDTDGDNEVSSKIFIPEIRATPGNKNIHIEWKNPPKNKPIDILVFVYETYNKDKGVKLSLVGNPSCSECEYIVKGLKNQIYYDVGIQVITKLGPSKMSNIETVAPVGPIDTQDISDVLLKTDSEIYKEMIDGGGFEDIPCKANSEMNSDGHILDQQIIPFSTFIENKFSSNKK